MPARARRGGGRRHWRRAGRSLTLSHELSHAGLEHVVLERGRVGQSWQGRWDDGDDPDGFMPRDDVVAHLVDHSTGFRAPVREGVDVSALGPQDAGGFALETSSGDVRSRQVVLATGAYQRPHRPPAAQDLPASLLAIDADDYTNPGALPDGAVLVVGSGQTGCQLAEELAEAGRDAYPAAGGLRGYLTRLDGRDTVAWVVETPSLDGTLAQLPSPVARP